MRIQTGDITKVTRGIICQQVNCRNAYGRGLSGVLAKQWPCIEREYRNFTSELLSKGIDPFGRTEYISIGPDLWCANIYAQRDYGNAAKTHKCYTDMDVLVNAVQSISVYAEKEKLPFYIPYGIGCGLAGGSWTEFANRAAKINGIILKLPDAPELM